MRPLVKLLRRCAPIATLSLLSLHDDALTSALARTRLADHRALAATCKRIRRVIRGKALSVVRDRDGWTEYGIFAIASTGGYDAYAEEGENNQFCCLTHKFDAGGSDGEVGPDGVPQAPMHFYEATTAVSDDGLLVVAGAYDHINDKETRHLCAYDSRVMCWLSRPMLRARRLPVELPEFSDETCIAFVQGRLIVAGGKNVEIDIDFIRGSRSTCFAWDAGAALWEQLPPMPVPTQDAAYGVIGARLYVVGGTHAPDAAGKGRPRELTTLQILDMDTRSWSRGPDLDALVEMSPKASSTMHGSREWSACGWRGRLYVVGCEHGYAHENGAPHEEPMWYNGTTEVYCFDPATNKWSTLPPLRSAMREGAGLCVHNGRLVVFGQRRPVQAGEFSRPMQGAIHYLTDSNTWKAWAHSDSDWKWTLPHFGGDPPEFHIMANPFNHSRTQTVASLPLR